MSGLITYTLGFAVTVFLTLAVAGFVYCVEAIRGKSGENVLKATSIFLSSNLIVFMLSMSGLVVAKIYQAFSVLAMGLLPIG